jgi:hypothetical protein
VLTAGTGQLGAVNNMPGLNIALSILSKLPRFIREAIMPDMLIPPIANDASKVQLARISHVYFEHPDLEKFREFAKDFGLVEAQVTKDRVYFRGYGKDPYVYVASRSKDGKPRFLGPAFVASSEEDFEKALKLEGAKVESLNNAPGGGKIVTFSRPDDTFFHVVHGQQETAVPSREPTATHEQQGGFNKPFDKPRLGLTWELHMMMTATNISQANSSGTTQDQLWYTSWATSVTLCPISTENWHGTLATSTLFRQIFCIIGISPISTS